jgi:hypothetical protein
MIYTDFTKFLNKKFIVNIYKSIINFKSDIGGVIPIEILQYLKAGD